MFDASSTAIHDVHPNRQRKTPPMLENGLYKKTDTTFDCTYYLALFLHGYYTVLSIQIVDSLPVERKKKFGVPAPGL